MESKIVGFSGSRIGLTCRQRDRLSRELTGVEVLHHGDCFGGDWEAWRMARERGIRTICHPPDSQRLRARTENDETRDPLPYLERTDQIIMESDRMVCCPGTREEQFKGSGTWAAIRHTIKARKPLLIIYPDGVVHRDPE